MYLNEFEFVRRSFIETNEFTKKWNELGFDDDYLGLLQEMIMRNPSIGKVIKGTGGIRKMRFQLPNKTGKRTGARVCYIDYEETKTTILLTVYVKKNKSDLTNKEVKNLRILEQYLKQKYGEKNE